MQKKEIFKNHSKILINSTLLIFLLSMLFYSITYIYRISFFNSFGIPSSFVEFIIDDNFLTFPLVIIKFGLLILIEISLLELIFGLISEKLISRNNVRFFMIANVLVMISVIILIFVVFEQTWQKKPFLSDAIIAYLIYLYYLLNWSYSLRLPKHTKKIKRTKISKILLKISQLQKIFPYVVLLYIFAIPILLVKKEAIKDAVGKETFSTIQIDNEKYLLFDPNNTYFAAIKINIDSMTIEKKMQLIPKNTSLEINIEKLGKINLE